VKKYLAWISIFLAPLHGYSEQTKDPIPSMEKSRFAYLEFYPNSDKRLTIQSIKCDPKKNDLQIQKFQTESKVTNGFVNVINVYAKSGNCKESPYSSVWQETVPIPRNGKHTHVYITILSDNITVL